LNIISEEDGRGWRKTKNSIDKMFMQGQDSLKPSHLVEVFAIEVGINYE
jgi:hypothetical protein